MKNLNFKMADDIHMQLKIASAVENRKMQDMVLIFIEQGLRRMNKRVDKKVNQWKTEPTEQAVAGTEQ